MTGIVIRWCWSCQRTELEGHGRLCSYRNLSDPWDRASRGASNE